MAKSITFDHCWDWLGFFWGKFIRGAGRRQPSDVDGQRATFAEEIWSVLSDQMRYSTNCQIWATCVARAFLLVIHISQFLPISMTFIWISVYITNYKKIHWPWSYIPIPSVELSVTYQWFLCGIFALLLLIKSNGNKTTKDAIQWTTNLKHCIIYRHTTIARMACTGSQPYIYAYI